MHATLRAAGRRDKYRLTWARCLITNPIQDQGVDCRVAARMTLHAAQPVQESHHGDEQETQAKAPQGAGRFTQIPGTKEED